MSKLLSQGGFGCVYYPGINCDGEVENNPDIVTKLQKMDFNAQNEIDIGTKVKEIPNYQLFYIPVISHCPIKLSLIDKTTLKQCEVVSSDKNTEYIIMDMNYIENYPFYEFLTDISRNKKNIILNILDTYNFLCNSIKILVEQGIVQFDFKSENILYSRKTQNPLIIDFGISLHMPSLNNNNWDDYFYIYAPDYYIWPLEVHCINYLLNENSDRLTINNINKIAKEVTKHNKGLTIFTNDFRSEYEKACVDALKPYINKSVDYTINELTKSYKTWDNYGLSILYLRLMEFLFGNHFFKNKLIIMFSQLLLINIHPDPKQRKTMEETIETYNAIFYKDEQIADYKNLASDLNYDNDEFTTKMLVDINDLKHRIAKGSKRSN
jgi:serine/threonine protein kinase